MDYYIYFHYRNDTKTPFYVGKGKGYRYRDFSKSKRNNFWKNIANKHGLTSVIAVENLSNTQALELEKMYISYFKSKGILLANLTDGGDGCLGYKHTEDSKKRLSKSLEGKGIDRNKYLFLNKTTSVSEYCTRSELAKKYKLHRSGITSILKGEVKTYKGWYIENSSFKPKNPNKYKQHTFYKKDGDVFVGTMSEFLKFDTDLNPAHIHSLVTGRRKKT